MSLLINHSKPELADEAILTYEKADDFEKWSVGERRILTTWCVGNALYQCYVEKQDLVRRAFKKVGLPLPIDGSEDHELEIKGFSVINIGDWKVQKNQPDLDLTDVDGEYDDYDMIEFLADGE